MELIELNPFVRYIGRHTMKYLNAKFNSCYDCRLFYVTGGEGNVLFDDKEIALAKDTALFFPPGTMYKFTLSNDNPLTLIVIDFDLTSEFHLQRKSFGTALEDNLDPKKLLLCPAPDMFKAFIVYDNAIPIRDLLLKVENGFIMSTPARDAMISAYLKLSLVMMVSLNTDIDANSKIVDDVCNYIRQNYSTPMTNEDIAEKFHYHPQYLSKIMKDETGKTLRQYLIYYRVCMAKRFLASTELSVRDVAWKSGFCSTSYFIKIFHHTVGETPNKYRTKHNKLHF